MAALLVGLCIPATACGTARTPSAPLVDNGPNAGLTNSDLVSKAIANMQALSSYHLQVVQRPLSGTAAATEVYTFTADSPQLPSYLKVWEPPNDSQPTGPQVLWTGQGVTWTDGNPRLEKIDGVITRHVVMTRPDGKQAPTPQAEASGSWSERTRSLHLWISTGDVPRVLQMRADVSGGEPGYVLGQSDSEPGFAYRRFPVFSPSGNRLTMYPWRAKGAQGLQIWDVTRPGSEPLYVTTSQPCFYGIGSSVRFSSNDNVLAVDTTCGEGQPEDLTIQLFDLSKQMTSYRSWQPRSWFSFAYSPDAKTLVLSTDEGIYTWDPEKEETPHLTWKAPPAYYFASRPEQISDIRYRPDGETIGATGITGVYLWYPTLPQGMQIPLLIPWLKPPSSFTSSLLFSPDNHTLLANLDGYQQVIVCDLTNVHDSRRVLDVPYGYMAGSISPDGRWLVLPDGTIPHAYTGDTVDNSDALVVDLQEKRPPLKLPGFTEAAFSPDSKYMASYTRGGSVQLWDLGNLKPGEPPGPPVDLTGGTSHGTPTPAEGYDPFSGVFKVSAIAFSADGTRLTVAASDGFVKQWKTADLANPAKAAAAKPTILMSRPDPEGLYGITWQWSRFNEDFGEVEPPPTGTIKEP